MAEAIVTIPPIGRENLIGSVLNHVCQIMYQTENTDVDNGRYVAWDFSRCSFLHPFFLGALSVLKSIYGDFVKCRNIPPAIADYLNLIYFHEPLLICPDRNDNRIWNRYYNKSYLPICKFDAHNEASIRAQELVQAAVNHQLGGRTHQILSYLLSELIDNITDHSHSEYGYVFCQRIPRQKALYVFIADVGNTIYASYATDQRYADALDNRESSALVLALNGKSTKNRPDNENRGYGISKTRKLVVEGLGGEFFLLSGSAFARHDFHGELVADLPESLRWEGTIALLKIPTETPADLNIYDYIS